MATLVAGCGSGGTATDVHSHPPGPTPPAERTPLEKRYVRDYKRLGTDVRALRAEALNVKKTSLLGTPRLRRLTGRFIEHLERSVLSLKARNRMIDHAAGAVATGCEQCFQMLEAVRPIPQIAH